MMNHTAEFHQTTQLYSRIRAQEDNDALNEDQEPFRGGDYCQHSHGRRSSISNLVERIRSRSRSHSRSRQ